MTYPFGPLAPSILAHASLVIGAARCWRLARDAGEPVQPALFARLEACRCGMLAPVFDGFLTVFEAASGRRLETGGMADRSLTDDELDLLDLLDGADRTGWARPVLASAMGIAARSARIMLDRVGNGTSPRDFPSILFADRYANSSAGVLSEGHPIGPAPRLLVA